MLQHTLTEQEKSLIALCKDAGLDLAPHRDFPIYRLWLFRWPGASKTWREGGATIEEALQAALRNAAWCIAALREDE